MRNVLDACCRENQNTRYMLNDIFHENHAICEIMWKNAVQPNRPQMIMWCMHFACWITNATETHLEYVILVAFSRQQRLREHASTLLHTYIAHHVSTSTFSGT
jgi:hypothetical protein